MWRSDGEPIDRKSTLQARNPPSNVIWFIESRLEEARLGKRFSFSGFQHSQYDLVTNYPEKKNSFSRKNKQNKQLTAASSISRSGTNFLHFFYRFPTQNLSRYFKNFYRTCIIQPYKYSV